MTTTNLSENIPFVTKRRYKYHDALITIGWDSVRRGYFLVIRKDSDEDQPFLSTFTQRRPYRRSLTPFLIVLEKLSLQVPEHMIEELKRDVARGRNIIMWHRDTPHAPTYNMTNHHFYTARPEGVLHVHMGWNLSLEGFFLIIEKEDDPEDPLWSNAEQKSRRYHYPQSLDLFLLVLEEFDIAIPQQMIEKIITDKKLSDISQVMHRSIPDYGSYGPN